MAGLIVKIHHTKSKNKGKFAEYIATRAGVDKSVNDKMSLEKPTQKQTEYIEKLLKSCPNAKESFEYEDYINNPTMKTASAFISVTEKENSDMFENREIYLNYISTRPRVEKFGTHGLFGAEDSVELSKVRQELSQNSGTMWTPIISLRREDAERLGYDNADNWRDLLRAKSVELAGILKIPYEDFKWYAAFHDEGHHPHTHMIIFSKDGKNGFLTEKGIEKVKSVLVREIFKNDLYEIYDEKGKMRELISDTVKDEIKSLAEKISSNDYSDSKVCEMLINLSRKLKNIKGKKVYGYLPKDIKNDVCEIVKAMAQDPQMENLYNKWCDIQRKIISIYRSTDTEFPPLWENKEFNKIRNAVIKEAVKLSEESISEDKLHIENETADEADEKNKMDKKENIKNNDIAKSAAYLFCRLANLIEDDMKIKINSHNKSILDTKQRREILKKKQQLGQKMG